VKTSHIKPKYLTPKNGVEYYFRIVQSRFSGLRNDIKYLFFTSFGSILLIEFVLKKIQPWSQFQSDFGVMYLNLCYSYFSAFVFYYLIIFAPMERRRINTLRYVNNNLLTIKELAGGILITLVNQVKPSTEIPSGFTQESIIKICKQINPNSPLTHDFREPITFRSHYEFINFKTVKILSLVRELIILNDLLDEELLRGLTNVNDAIQRLTLKINIPPKEDMDMEFLGGSLYNLYQESNELVYYFKKIYDKKYSFQYHKNEIERNKRRKIEIPTT